MKRIYTEVAMFENGNFMLRKVSKDDAEDLLKVYSDKKSLPFFNSDNCHGDIFFYDTLKKMNKALDFWEHSYEKEYFVRWSVIEKKSNKTVGTIELFHRDAEDYFSNCGILRLDLRSDYENAYSIISILNLIVPYTFEIFGCDKIATKGIEPALERRKALSEMGFCASDEVVKGNDGVSEYNSYFVKLR